LTCYRGTFVSCAASAAYWLTSWSSTAVIPLGCGVFANSSSNCDELGWLPPQTRVIDFLSPTRANDFQSAGWQEIASLASSISVDYDPQTALQLLQDDRDSVFSKSCLAAWLPLSRSGRMLGRAWRQYLRLELDSSVLSYPLL